QVGFTVKNRWVLRLWVVGILLTLMMGCRGGGAEEEGSGTNESAGPVQDAVLQMPEMAPAALEGRALRAVATTSIIGDVVGQVGGEAIALTTLMAPGQDPHSYEPSTTDLTHVAEADVI